MIQKLGNNGDCGLRICRLELVFTDSLLVLLFEIIFEQDL